MRRYLFITILGSALIIFSAKAQDETTPVKPTLNWSGFTHIWTGYGQRDDLDGHYGFAVRYLRFKAYGVLAENVKWTTQFAFDKGAPSMLDVFIAWEPHDAVKVKFGQFPVPGAKSGVFSSSIWSTTKMNFNDRTTITQNWASNAGLKGYRSGGAMFYGSVLEKKISYFLMVAMPQAGPDNYFNPSVKSTVYAHDQNGEALFSRLEFMPIEKMEVGVNFHLGRGTIDDTVTTNRGSYSFYLLSRQEKLFVMAEYIAGTNNQYTNSFKDSEFSYNGYFIELAYKLAKKYEPAIRYDSYTPVKDAYNVSNDGYEKYDNLTIGFNYYPHKNIALMLNYVARMESPEVGYSTVKNDLVYFQLRYKFSSK